MSIFNPNRILFDFYVAKINSQLIVAEKKLLEK